MVDPDQQQLQQVLSELRDVNKDRRRTAVMKLGMMGGDQAVRTLMTTVENSNEDLIVRGRAAMMLGKLRDTRAVGSLIRALDAPGFQTPYNAIQALGLLDDSRAIEPLQLVFETRRGKLQEAAEAALLRLGVSASVDTTSPR